MGSITRQLFGGPVLLSAVYFLLKGLDVVYVGQSKTVLRRLERHRLQHTGEFDSYRILPVAPQCLLDVEAAFIGLFRPGLNHQRHDLDEYGREVLRSIGITVEAVSCHACALLRQACSRHRRAG